MAEGIIKVFIHIVPLPQFAEHLPLLLDAQLLGQSPRLPVGDVSRQPFFLAILLEFAVREDIEKAGCSTGCKDSVNL